MTWQPLLVDASRDRAWEGVQAIVNHLAPLVRAPGDDPSLASGTTGQAVLHAYAGRNAYQTQDQAAVAIRCLEHAVAAMTHKPAPASLYDGLTGMGWAISHLDSLLPGLDGADDLAEIDELLLDHLDRSPWPGPYNLCDGLVGFGVYALERLPRPAAVACLRG